MKQIIIGLTALLLTFSFVGVAQGRQAAKPVNAGTDTTTPKTQQPANQQNGGAATPNPNGKVINLTTDLLCKDCQDKNVIVYDASCKVFYFSKQGSTGQRVYNLKDIKIDYNKEVKFKIININRYMYDVKFSVDDIEFGSEPPALFNQLFLGTGTYLEGLVTAAGQPKAGANNAVLPFIRSLTEFKKTYDQLLDNYVKVYFHKADLACIYKVGDLFSTLSEKLSEIKQKYYELSVDLANSVIEKEGQLAAAKKNYANTTKK